METLVADLSQDTTDTADAESGGGGGSTGLVADLTQRSQGAASRFDIQETPSEAPREAPLVADLSQPAKPEAPGWGRWLLGMAPRVALPLAGAAIGAGFGGVGAIPGWALGAGIGGALGEGASRALTGEELKPLPIATAGALSMIPGIPSARLGVKVLEGAGQGLLGATAMHMAEQGRFELPSAGEAGAGMTFGAVLGAVFGKLFPYRAAEKTVAAMRLPMAELPAESLSTIELRAARRARAQQTLDEAARGEGPAGPGIGMPNVEGSNVLGVERPGGRPVYTPPVEGEAPPMPPSGPLEATPPTQSGAADDIAAASRQGITLEAGLRAAGWRSVESPGKQAAVYLNDSMPGTAFKFRVPYSQGIFTPDHEFQMLTLEHAAAPESVVQPGELITSARLRAAGHDVPDGIDGFTMRAVGTPVPKESINANDLIDPAIAAQALGKAGIRDRDFANPANLLVTEDALGVRKTLKVDAGHAGLTDPTTALIDNSNAMREAVEYVLVQTGRPPADDATLAGISTAIREGDPETIATAIRKAFCAVSLH